MPVRRDQTSKAFEKDLHPSERGYLQRHVDLLHSLTILCRDALRRHFTGHQIHKYMDSAKYTDSFERLQSSKRSTLATVDKIEMQTYPVSF